MKDYYRKLSTHDRQVFVDSIDRFLMSCCLLDLISPKCNALSWEKVVEKYLRQKYSKE